MTLDQKDPAVAQAREKNAASELLPQWAPVSDARWTGSFDKQPVNSPFKLGQAVWVPAYDSIGEISGFAQWTMGFEPYTLYEVALMPAGEPVLLSGTALRRATISKGTIYFELSEWERTHPADMSAAGVVNYTGDEERAATA